MFICISEIEAFFGIAMTYLQLLSLCIAFIKFGWVGSLPYQTPVTLKVVGADPKSYFNSDILLYMEFRMLSTTEYRGFVLWNFVGRTFDSPRSKYVVTNLHYELL